MLPLLHNNLVATVNVLVAAARAGGCRVVTAGSLEEPELDAVEAPIAPYAAAKQAAGRYARMFSALYGLPVVNLRIFMAYGPGQHEGKVVPSVILALLRGEPPRLSSALHPFDWVYVDDVVDAFVAAGRAPGLAGETIDVGSGELRNVRDIVAAITEILGADVEPEFGAVPDRPFETIHVADTERTGTSSVSRLARACARALPRLSSGTCRSPVDPARPWRRESCEGPRHRPRGYHRLGACVAQSG